VARVRVHLASGEPLELPPLATLPDVGVSLFATLLPQTAGLVSVTAIGAKARSSNRRTWPGTSQAGSASCGGTATRRLDKPQSSRAGARALGRPR
jgi:hypothetical protein